MVPNRSTQTCSDGRCSSSSKSVKLLLIDPPPFGQNRLEKKGGSIRSAFWEPSKKCVSDARKLKNDAIFRRAARAEPQNGPRYRSTLTNRHFLTEEVISGRAARADTQTNTKFQTPFSIGRILDRNVIGFCARSAQIFFTVSV